jgi:acyl carrier protein
MSRIGPDDIRKVIQGLDLDVDPNKLEPGRALASQGIDSLDLANLLFGVEESLGVNLSDDFVGSAQGLSINDLVQYINEHLARNSNT